jgi:hypothetical protein
LTISSIAKHKDMHLTRALQEAQVEEIVADAKVILRRSEKRARMLDAQFEADPNRIASAREAREHDAMLLRATGNWREQQNINLMGGVVLTPGDKADADFLKIVDDPLTEERLPGFRDYYTARITEKLMAELEQKEAPAVEAPLLLKSDADEVVLGDADVAMSEVLR